MLSFKKSLKHLSLFILVLFAFANSNAQKKDTAATQQIVVPVQDTLVSYIVKKIESYTFTIKRDRSMIRRTIKVNPITDAIPDIEKILNVFSKRIANKDRPMNLRSLNSVSILLKENTNKLRDYQATLGDYFTQLSQSNVALKKISDDNILTSKVSDTSLVSQMSDLLNDAKKLDSTQKTMMAKVTVVQNKVSVLLLQANDIISEISYLNFSAKKAMWGQEDKPLLQSKPSDYNQSFASVIANTISRNGKIISIFLSNKLDTLTIALLLLILISTWCWLNLSRVKKDPEANQILAPILFLRKSVIVCSLILLLTILPFFFTNPQMAFLHACELLRLIMLAVLLFPYLSRQAKPLWLVLCILWLYYALDDLLLEVAFAERWLLLIAAIILIVVCVLVIQRRKIIFQKIVESPARKALLIFCITLAALSILFNLTGRTTLSKMFGVTAIQSLILGVTLKVVSTFIMESIYIQSEAYKKSRLSSYINYEDLQHKLLRILWVIAGIIWIISLLIDFSLYDVTKLNFTNFFLKQRTIGSMQFNYQSVLLFIGIIWFSSVISGFINFFFGHEKSKIPTQKTRMGSMMLLIRLAIWTIGFIIAVAAAGIPIQKISLMIGALGVGIGFGLQNITNNLVSGIILAFERPIEIGDHIEVGDKAGIVNEIGVRSSKLKSLDGADIIVPNGDLLSQHLINWTKQDRNKRINFVISIAYDSNLLQVKQIIQETALKNEGVLKSPAPAALIKSFADSAIEIQVYFWVPEVFNAPTTKSNVMTDVYNALLNNNIVIPYPIVTIIQEKKD